MLDFQPNAVHAGIYQALAARLLRRRAASSSTVREPSSVDRRAEAARRRAAPSSRSSTSTTSALARERGIDVVGVGAIVGRPLAAVIAARPRRGSRRPPTSRAARSASPACRPTTRCSTRCSRPAAPTPTRSDRVTIGFDAVAALAAGRLDAATAFWNAEGVALRELGVPTREFRVDDYGAPRYPELVLATSAETLRERPGAGRVDRSRRPARGLRRPRRRPRGRARPTCSRRSRSWTPAEQRAPARRADRPRTRSADAGRARPRGARGLGPLGPRARDPGPRRSTSSGRFPALAGDRLSAPGGLRGPSRRRRWDAEGCKPLANAPAAGSNTADPIPTRSRALDRLPPSPAGCSGSGP